MITIWKARYAFAACLSSATLVLAAGCGGGRGEVSGTVRLGRTPLSGGRIEFTSVQGPGASAFAWIGEDGSYTVHDCPTGAVKITVLPVEHSRGKVDARKAARSRPLAIPTRYTSLETTDLDYTVTRRAQTKDVELKP